MEELLNYLIAQREERASKVSKYEEAVKELEAAKAKVDAFGDIGCTITEIETLERHIATVSEKIGAVEVEEEAGIEDEVVADEE